MNLFELYQQKVDSKVIVADEKQLGVVAVLEEIRQQLVGFSFFRQRVKGLYVWGGVGIGKTFLMDIFCQSLGDEKYLRLHFHQFMHSVHEQLTALQGKRNPLKIIAKKFAKQARVLCFDEFYVTDITDAMLLSELLQELIACKVCFVTTSNVKPDQLYKNGLQRQRFLPAIDLILKYTTVIHLNTTADYRLQHIREQGAFYWPLGEKAQQKMEKSFSVFSRDAEYDSEPLILYGREIKVIKKTQDVIWFNFHVLCGIPRSQEDYLVIAERYRYVFVSDVPELGQHDSDLVLNFIKLIDVLYDSNIRVIISAEKPLYEIYKEGHVKFEFARTHSRLVEMQSETFFEDDEV